MEGKITNRKEKIKIKRKITNNVIIRICPNRKVKKKNNNNKKCNSN